jgi:integrase
VARHAPLKHQKEGEWRDIPAPGKLNSVVDRLPVRNNDGGMPCPDLFRKSWDRAIRRLGIRDHNPRDLRHTWATMTLRSGVPLHEVSRWTGHRSVRVTADRYGPRHLPAASAAGRLLGPSSAAPAQRMPSSRRVRRWAGEGWAGKST